MQEKNQKFSFRKYSFGLASVAVASFFVSQGQKVLADEFVTDSLTEQYVAASVTQVENKSVTEDTVVESYTIASPTTYIADNTQDVGDNVLEVKGQDGQLLIRETSDGLISERLEPTKSIEVLGTKPKVEETLLEKAEITYIANDQLEYGQEVVKEEGNDKKQVTTTTYRILETEVADRKSNDYVSKVEYSVDNSKRLPSDKIIIEDSKVFSEGKDDMDIILHTHDEMLKIISNGKQTPLGLSDYIQSEKFSDLSDNLQYYFENQVITSDQYADIKAAYAEYLKAIEAKGIIDKLPKTVEGQVMDRITEIFLEDVNGNEYLPDVLAYKRTINSDQELENHELFERYQKILTDENIMYYYDGYSDNIIENGSLKRIIIEKNWDSEAQQHVYNLGLRYVSESDSYGPTQVTRKKRFLDYLTRSNLDYEIVDENHIRINQELYKISFRKTPSGGAGVAFVSFEEEHEKTNNLFNSLTKRYNNLLGYSEELDLIFKSQLITEEEKTWFTEQLHMLPTAIKKNLVHLIVLDGEVDSYFKGARGINNPGNTVILSYTNTGGKIDLLRVLLHELSHGIDKNADVLSSSREFYDFYLNSINPEINQADIPVKDYYKSYNFESFSEFFGEYLLKRIYGYDYTKFIEIDGEILTLRPYDFRDLDEDVEKGREAYNLYYNDERAYSPIEDAEWLFDKIYTLLFESPTQAEIVVDQVTTEIVSAKNKVIEVGTKMQVVKEVTEYTTIEMVDENLLLGERKVIQFGQNGIVETTTTYELVDNRTGEIMASTTNNILQNLVNEVVVVGVKEIVVDETLETPSDDVSTPVDETLEIPSDDVSTPVDETLETPSDDVSTPVDETLETPSDDVSTPVDETLETPTSAVPIPVEKTSDLSTEKELTPVKELIQDSSDKSIELVQVEFNKIKRKSPSSGYTKSHTDTSMKTNDSAAKQLPDTGDQSYLLQLIGTLNVALGLGARRKKRTKQL